MVFEKLVWLEWLSETLGYLVVVDTARLGNLLFALSLALGCCWLDTPPLHDRVEASGGSKLEWRPG